MRIVVLFRHGEAYPDTIDPSRSLTERGKVETRKVAEALGRAGVKIEEIIHSPKLRAKQTAEIVSKILGVTSLRESPLLLPDTDPRKTMELIRDTSHNILLCGHLPNLARVFSLLYLGKDTDKSIELNTSGAVGLVEVEEWVLSFLLDSSLL